MAKKYEVGYIFDESELKDVADFCNSTSNLMTTTIESRKKEVNGNEITVRKFKIIEIPQEILKEHSRNRRNYYLRYYVDEVVSNPLRWADLSEEEQKQYADYRRYLLDYTKTENWWLSNPLTLDEWKNK